MLSTFSPLQPNYNQNVAHCFKSLGVKQRVLGMEVEGLGPPHNIGKMLPVACVIHKVYCGLCPEEHGQNVPPLALFLLQFPFLIDKCFFL